MSPRQEESETKDDESKETEDELPELKEMALEDTAAVENENENETAAESVQIIPDGQSPADSAADSGMPDIINPSGESDEDAKNGNGDDDNEDNDVDVGDNPIPPATSGLTATSDELVNSNDAKVETESTGGNAQTSSASDVKKAAATKAPPSAASAPSATNPMDVCPICLNQNLEEQSNNPDASDASPIRMIRTPCQHTFCNICIEQVLEAHGEATERFPSSAPIPSSAPSSRTAKNVDTHLNAPTVGRCPMCRAELSLFELTDAFTNEIAYPKSSNWHSESQLAGCVFVPYGRHATGNKSFHFPFISEPQRKTASSTTTITSSMPTMPLPYMDVSQCIAERPNEWKLANGDCVSPHLQIHDGHFHFNSRTFHGTIRFPNDNRFRGCYEWNIILGISQNGKFLSSGLIIERSERVLIHCDESMSKHDIRECQYPLEGDWQLTWSRDGNTNQQSSTLTVLRNSYQQSKWDFVIHFTTTSDDHASKDSARIYWPKSDTIQTATRGLDFAKQPKGPDVGQIIEWETTNSQFPKIAWKRLTRGKLPQGPHQATVLGAAQDQVLYQLLMHPGSSTQAAEPTESIQLLPAIPTYHGDSLWGNVFVKKFRIGQASYHFLSPTASYLSYEHIGCRNLPNLDDGTPLPTRLPFRNMEWDPSTLRLTATIEWEQDAGTSWNDNVRWKLDMSFDSQFMVIKRGGIQCEWCKERRAPIRPPRRPPPTRPKPVAIYVPPPPPEEGQPPPPEPNRNEEWLMSGYGYDQLYINAACLERYRPNAPAVEDARATFDHYAKTFLQHRRRLQAEDVTARSIEYLEKVFKAAAERPGTNPIDYNIT